MYNEAMYTQEQYDEVYNQLTNLQERYDTLLKSYRREVIECVECERDLARANEMVDMYSELVSKMLQARNEGHVLSVYETSR
jgi:hypothetical protein